MKFLLLTLLLYGKALSFRPVSHRPRQYIVHGLSIRPKAARKELPAQYVSFHRTSTLLATPSNWARNDKKVASPEGTPPRNDATKDAKRRNFHIVRLGENNDWRGIEKLYWKESEKFSIVNISTMLSWLSKMDCPPDDFEKLMLDVAQWIDDYGVENVDTGRKSYMRRSTRSMKLSATVLERFKVILPMRDGKGDTVSEATKEINKRLVAMGRQHDWKGILETWQAERGQFNGVNYATATNQLGKVPSLDVRDPRLDELLEDIAIHLRNGAALVWEAKHLANILHAIAKRKLKSKAAAALFDLIPKIRIVKEGNAQDISNTAWALVTYGVNDPELFRLIDEKSDYLVSNGTPQAIANTAWAFATLGFKSPALFAAINERAEYLVLNGTPQNIANAAWACATLGLECPALFAAINDRAEYLVVNGKPQAIANTAWAFATSGIKSPALFAAINDRAEYLVMNGNPQAVANTAWACATLGDKCPALFAAINERAEYLVVNGKPQAIANTAWAFATSGIKSPALFAAINDRAEYLVMNGNPQAVANTAWACATLGDKCPALFAAINERAEYLVLNGTPQNIANTAWACATLGVECPALFAAINDKADYLVSNGKPQAIANTAWACATLGVECPALFAAINERAEYLVLDGNPQSIANTAWACATLGVECSSLFEAIDERFEELASNLDPQSISNLCFSLAILDYLEDDGRLFKALWEAALSCNDKLSGVRHMQLLQSYWMVSTVLEILPPSVKWMSSIGNFTFASNESKMQKEMSDCLLDLGFAHEVEVSPFKDDKLNAQGFLAIDAACKDRMIAMEFDGPSHFLREAGTGKILAKENGLTKAKRRLLQRLGWTVVNVPYFDWETATTRFERKKLLRDKLKAAGVPIREL